MDSGLSEQVRQFIARYIVSIEQIEILVLLSDAPDRIWSVEEVFKVIKSSRESIGQRLKVMEAQGILRAETMSPVGYRFQPTNKEMRENIEAFKVDYRVRPVQVIEAVFATPGQARIFANAFKFKKDDHK